MLSGSERAERIGDARWRSLIVLGSKSSLGGTTESERRTMKINVVLAGAVELDRTTSNLKLLHDPDRSSNNTS